MKTTLQEATNRLMNTPMKCPSCGEEHTYQQVKENHYVCPKTNIEITVGSGIFSDQEIKLWHGKA